jgi:S-adenosylmethionine/arginine decarboxylase-like enzyme
LDFYCPVCDSLLDNNMRCSVCDDVSNGVPVLRQRLVLEATGCNGLDNIDRAYDFLVDVADAIHVTLYSQPIVMKTPGQGLTGIAVLLESAEVLHTWPEYWFMDFYIESCKPFDPKVIYGKIHEHFSPESINEVVNSRLIS